MITSEKTTQSSFHQEDGNSHGHTLTEKHQQGLYLSKRVMLYNIAGTSVYCVNNPRAMQKTRVRSLGQEDPLEKGMATHSSIRAQRIPWTEKHGGL